MPALCSYGPLHYMEVPELFMEFISSMTGKSPSTTGAGSEGALTKGPFNALPAIIDLNANLLSYVLTGHDGWLSAAGYVGPHVKVDHDFSLLVPELFARMTPQERDARNLIAEGALEKIADVEHQGAAGARQPAGLPDDRADGDEVLRPDLPAPRRRVHPGDAAPRAAGRRGLRRVGQHHRDDPRAGRPRLRQGRHHLAGDPAAAGAARDHGRRRRRRRAGSWSRRSSAPCSPASRCWPRLVRRAAGGQAGGGERSGRRRARGDREVRDHPGQPEVVDTPGTRARRPGWACRPGWRRPAPRSSGCPARSSPSSSSAPRAAPRCRRRRRPRSATGSRSALPCRWASVCPSVSACPSESA